MWPHCMGMDLDRQLAETLRSLSAQYEQEQKSAAG